MPKDDDFPDDLLGFWVCEDGTKSLHIARGRQSDGERLWVDVWKGLGEEQHLERAITSWVPRRKGAEGGPGRARLGYLNVELGEPGLGTTYALMLAYPNEDKSTWGGYDWRAFPADGDPKRARLFPEGGASFYEAVLGAWDDFVEDLRDNEQDWIEPLSTYRPATQAEITALASLMETR